MKSLEQFFDLFLKVSQSQYIRTIRVQIGEEYNWDLETWKIVRHVNELSKSLRQIYSASAIMHNSLKHAYVFY